MAYNDITPVKKAGIVGTAYIQCNEDEATHWVIEVGFDGNCGELVLPSRKAAESCMELFVSPYERGEIYAKIELLEADAVKMQNESSAYVAKIQKLRYALDEARKLLVASNIEAPETMKLLLDF
jgi:hypothetical protein